MLLHLFVIRSPLLEDGVLDRVRLDPNQDRSLLRQVVVVQAHLHLHHAVDHVLHRAAPH